MGCRDLKIKINFWEDQTKGLFLTRMIVNSDIPVITVSAEHLLLFWMWLSDVWFNSFEGDWLMFGLTLLNVIDWCLV